MLFIIKSNENNRCEQTLKFMNKDDKIILIQDGVLLAHNNNNKFISAVKNKGAEILVLENDLNLRGIKNNIDAKMVAYEDMIGLIEKNKVFS